MNKGCPHKEQCPVARYFGRTGWTKFRHQYCDTNYEECQRFQAEKKGHAVPDHMMPWDKLPDRV